MLGKDDHPILRPEEVTMEKLPQATDKIHKEITR